MLRVLIVDDEPLVRTGIRYRIPWGEYRMQVVAEAGSVQEAIAVLQGQEIDVVFTDIVMPGGTAWNCCSGCGRTIPSSPLWCSAIMMSSAISRVRCGLARRTIS
jgi:two-component system response regulator YesN|nr:response regulator [uncultured Acetatifactor sp.]